MTEKRQVCEQLWEEYKTLSEKTHINVESYVPGKPLTPHYIDPNDLVKKEELRLKLLDCKEVLNLNPEQWFDIENG